MIVVAEPNRTETEIGFQAQNVFKIKINFLFIPMGVVDLIFLNDLR